MAIAETIDDAKDFVAQLLVETWSLEAEGIQQGPSSSSDDGHFLKAGNKSFAGALTAK
jgi:hypothetical protein